MPLIQIGSKEFFGHESREAFMHDVAEVQNARDRASARAWKWMRMPVLSATIASNAVSAGAGVAGSAAVGPESGYAWVIMRLLLSGLAAGATPDVVNVFRSGATQDPLWQFNGNNFGYTFSRYQMALLSGETFSFQNVGTIAATGQVRLSGDVIEVPAEKMYQIGG